MPINDARVAYAECPLCGSADFSEYRRADCSNHRLFKPQLPALMRWMRCGACSHQFTDGYFSDEALKVMFSDAHEGQQLGGGDWHYVRQVASKMVEKVCAELGAQQGRWLDVGCGSGALLTTAQEYGFDVVGIDLRPRTVELLEKAGLEAHLTSLEDFVPSQPLTVISMADVLEHVPFPRPALAHAATILAPGGILFASMPNTDAFIWRHLDGLNMNPFWGEIEHYHNFGRKRLYEVLVQHGFEPLRYGISERYYMCMEVIAKKPG